MKILTLALCTLALIACGGSMPDSQDPDSGFTPKAVTDTDAGTPNPLVYAQDCQGDNGWMDWGATQIHFFYSYEEKRDGGKDSYCHAEINGQRYESGVDAGFEMAPSDCWVMIDPAHNATIRYGWSKDWQNTYGQGYVWIDADDMQVGGTLPDGGVPNIYSNYGPPSADNIDWTCVNRTL